jgi:two-component system, sensor histidine kinase and response regulator
MKAKLSIAELTRNLNDLEDKLRVIEAERNSIIDNIPFMSWIKDIDGKFLYVNQPYLDAFKLKFKNVIGKTVFDIFPYDYAQQCHQEDHKVIEQKRTINFQTKRDNEWFSTVKSPLLGPNDEILGTTGFERNITDNIETLNSLRKERDLLQALMENIPDTIYFKDVKSRFIRINKAKALEIGIENPYDAISKSDFDFYDREKADSNLKDEELILSTGVPLISKEEKVIKGTGEEMWISTTKSPIKDEKANIIGLVGISRDISKQKEIIRKLNEERDFLQVLMDYIPYTIYFKDLDCRFTKINKAQARLIGVEKPEDAVGKTDFDFFAGKHAKSAYEDEKRIMSTGIPLIEKIELVMDADGNNRWVSATKIPVKDILGNITGLVGISIDVTEKRIAEDKLRESKEKAEESDRLKTAFLANMSHEIRTPMNGIIGFSNLMRNPELNEEERRDFLNHIISCGNTLLNLIDDIIDISKIEAGQIKIRIAESNINAILEELFDSFKASRLREGKEHIKLQKKVSLTSAESIVLTDPFRLRQIISNLIGNAFKFTLEGFIEFGYSLEATDNLLFYVKDTGVGIPEDKQQLIFERFGQVLDSNFYINQKGTGLGLAISSNLVKLLGGKMWVVSELGKGSTFYFTLPYNHIDDLTIAENSSVSGDEQISLYNGKTILIAEDEEINYLYFKQIFKHTNASLIWAKNGIEAIESVKNNPDVSIVLMDCKMPQMDGYTATVEIKILRPELPVIAQTAFAMADEEEKSLQAGCDGYISKPIRVKDLFVLLNKYFSSDKKNSKKK